MVTLVARVAQHHVPLPSPASADLAVRGCTPAKSLHISIRVKAWERIMREILDLLLDPHRITSLPDRYLRVLHLHYL